MKTKKLYRLTWIRPWARYRVKIYENIGFLKSAITYRERIDWTTKEKVRPIEGDDFKVEVCEVPDYEEIWQPYELGTWESTDSKLRRRRGLK